MPHSFYFDFHGVASLSRMGNRQLVGMCGIALLGSLLLLRPPRMISPPLPAQRAPREGLEHAAVRPPKSDSSTPSERLPSLISYERSSPLSARVSSSFFAQPSSLNSASLASPQSTYLSSAPSVHLSSPFSAPLSSSPSTSLRSSSEPLLHIAIGADLPHLPGAVGAIGSIRFHSKTPHQLRFHVITLARELLPTRAALSCYQFAPSTPDDAANTGILPPDIHLLPLSEGLFAGRLRVLADPAITGRLDSPLNFA